MARGHLDTPWDPQRLGSNGLRPKYADDSILYSDTYSVESVIITDESLKKIIIKNECSKWRSRGVLRDKLSDLYCYSSSRYQLYLRPTYIKSVCTCVTDLPKTPTPRVMCGGGGSVPVLILSVGRIYIRCGSDDVNIAVNQSASAAVQLSQCYSLININKSVTGGICDVNNA